MRAAATAKANDAPWNEFCNKYFAGRLKKNRNYNASISFHDVPVAADGLPAKSAVSKYRRKAVIDFTFSLLSGRSWRCLMSLHFPLLTCSLYQLEPQRSNSLDKK